MSVAREAVDRLGSAFLSGDADTVLGEFAPTEEVLYSGSEPGEVAVGRTALRALLGDLLSRDERYSWQAGAIHEVATGSQLHVVAEGELTVHVPAADGWRAQERLPYRVSGVLERGAATAPEWRWRSCFGSEPAPASSD